MPIGLTSDFINTSALRYFYEVARSGSFRRAAEKIHVAASAISRQIHLLEDELGVELFERGRKGVRLTVAGEALIYRVSRVMTELTTARAEVGALQGPNRGHVALGVNETVAREFITDFLARFHTTYPGITFTITVGNTVELVEMLLRSDIEILVGYGVPERKELERVSCFNLETCITVRTQHPLAQRRWVRVSDLVDEELILPDETSFLRKVLDAMFAQASLDPRSSITTNSFELMANMVAAGLGIGVQIRLAAGTDNIRPDIAYVPLRDSEIRAAALGCCLRVGRTPSAAVNTCVQHLSAALQDWTKSLS